MRAQLLRRAFTGMNEREFGAEGGSRTHTGVTPMDFESIASAIPPLRLWVTRLSSV